MHNRIRVGSGEVSFHGEGKILVSSFRIWRAHPLSRQFISQPEPIRRVQSTLEALESAECMGNGESFATAFVRS